jgi:hypothetical protein
MMHGTTNIKLINMNVYVTLEKLIYHYTAVYNMREIERERERERDFSALMQENNICYLLSSILQKYNIN